VGLHTQRAQRPVEARARPVAPRDRLVDAGREQQLGRDLAPPLGQADFIPAHQCPACAVAAITAQPRGVDGVR